MCHAVELHVVGSGVFCFLCLSEELDDSSFAVFSAPFPEKEILDYLADGPII